MTEPRKKQAQLRNYPYPYRAAFTIASDRHGIDDTDQFLSLHRYLNTTAETPSGPGLDLEIGDTFWFYDDIGKFSYFQGFTNKPSPQAGLILDFLKSGYIDGLHTYGDFSNHTFERKYAEWAVEEMNRLNLCIPLWINHGDRSNIQNINRGVPFHQGATPDSPAYHVDLTLKMGLTFLWQDVTPFIGQDRLLNVGEYVSPSYSETSRPINHFVKRSIKYALMTGDRLLGSPFDFTNRYGNNQLLIPYTVDYGIVLLEFKRFNSHLEGMWKGARVIDLVYQLRPEVLDRLIATEGYMIVYNHLEYGDMHNPEVAARMRDLSRRNHEGDIWVTTTHRMLRYNLIHHCLSWNETITDDKLRISIDPSMALPNGKTEIITANDLEGFCFQIPNEYTPTVCVGDQDLKVTCLSKGTKISIYGTSWRRLEYPHDA